MNIKFRWREVIFTQGSNENAQRAPKNLFKDVQEVYSPVIQKMYAVAPGSGWGGGQMRQSQTYLVENVLGTMVLVLVACLEMQGKSIRRNK